MEDNQPNRESKSSKKLPSFQIFLIGIIFLGSSIFGFFESSFLNTYLEHILHLQYIYISIMVSVSAVFGLIFYLVFGVLSDNTRSKYGRRRPYLLYGIIAGICMFLYAFSPSFFWCFILDSIIIGVFSNAFYAGRAPLVPDIIEVEQRGRANGIITIFTMIGSMLPVGLSLYVNEFYGVLTTKGTVITPEGYIFVLGIGGFSMVFVSILGFLFIKEKPISGLPLRKKFFEDLKDSFQYKKLKENKDFYKIILALAVFNIGIRIITPFYFNYFFSLGLSTIGLMIGIIIILPIAFIMIIIFGKLTDAYGRKKFIAPSILISCVGMIIIPFFKPDSILTSIIFVVAIILMMISMMGIQVPLAAWQQDLLPEEKKGQFLGILNFFDTIPQIPGAIIGGVIADTFGIQWIFIFVPIFLIGSIPFFLIIRETLQKK